MNQCTENNNQKDSLPKSIYLAINNSRMRNKVLFVFCCAELRNRSFLVLKAVSICKGCGEKTPFKLAVDTLCL